VPRPGQGDCRAKSGDPTSDNRHFHGEEVNGRQGRRAVRQAGGPGRGAEAKRR
jgi:hypothetical protein